MKRLLILFVSLTLIVSCSKEEDPVQDPNQDPIEIKQPDGYYFVGTPNEQAKKFAGAIYNQCKNFPKVIIYAYDENQKLIEFKGFLQFYSDGKFIFDKEGKLIEYKINPEISFSFNYNDNSIVGIAADEIFEWEIKIDNHFNPVYMYSNEISSGKISGGICDYDVNNRIIKEEWWQDGIKVGTTIFEYKTNGNLLKTYTEYNSTPQWFEYNSESILIWKCWISDNFAENTDDDTYNSEFYNLEGKIVREEHRTMPDSSLIWFKYSEISELGIEQIYAYSVKKDFAINLSNPTIYRYKGDTILSSYVENNQDGNTIKNVYSTLIGYPEDGNDITKYFFIHVMREYNNQGKEISEIMFTGDFRLNLIEYRRGDYTYSDIHGKIIQKMEYDSNDIAVYRYTYEYVFNSSTGEYDYFQFNCYNAQTDELLWYRDKDGIKRKPDGTLY